MRNLLFAVMALLLPFVATGQDGQGYQMFENFYITPKAGMGAELEAAMGAHNKKYHAEPPYAAQVYYVINGENAGKYVWSMGPATWTDHENRPSDDGHDTDWDKNVGTLIDEYGSTDFWKLDVKHSRFTGAFDLNKLQLWIVDIKDGQMYRANAIFKKVNEVHEAMDEVPFGIYRKQMSGSEGPDLAMIWFFDSLAWFDEEPMFRKHYEEINGEGSFQQLLDEWDDVVESLQNEVWVFQPEMSGHDGKGMNRGSDE